jgi:hypothetical protein
MKYTSYANRTIEWQKGVIHKSQTEFCDDIATVSA